MVIINVHDKRIMISKLCLKLLIHVIICLHVTLSRIINKANWNVGKIYDLAL